MREFELIKELIQGAPSNAVDLHYGVGDDCAVISGPGIRDRLVTTDALVEGTHFRREWSDFKTLGRKVLAVNISDIAAMGGLPKFYLVTLGLPPDFDSAEIFDLYSGMREIAKEYGASLIGGDVAATSGPMWISITMVGEIKSGKALLRRGAAKGDAIYVTGCLGSAALGLHCLKNEIKAGEAKRFIEKFRNPVPRIRMGDCLQNSDMVASMIDISDGLLSDLSHIADESEVGFVLELDKIPRENGFDGLAKGWGADPAMLVLAGGEDYELAFTVRSNRITMFEEGPAKHFSECTAIRIGTVHEDPLVRQVLGQDGEPMEIKAYGYEHFASSPSLT